MKKALFIVGPTAVGKTSLALNIAEKTSGELVNADSMQVYKGLDIVSGKDIPRNSKTLKSSVFFKGSYLKNYLFENIPVHLLDVVEPDYSFNLRDFVRVSQAVLKDIWLRGKLPIVVGGNGYYIDSFFNKISTINIPPNFSLRKELDNTPVKELQKALKKIDPNKLESMNNSDKNNKRRLVRAIEIASDNRNEKSIETLRFDSLVIGLKPLREKVVELIKKRAESRLKKGALKEVKLLFKNFDKLSPQVKKAIGYKELFAYIKGEKSMEMVIEEWKKSELFYVKKQLTWFKKNKKIIWVDPTIKNEIEKIESKVLEWYNQTYK